MTNIDPFSRDALFTAAIKQLDALHAEDPRYERAGEEDVPAELLYARRMSAWLERVAPQASAALRLAVRAQHLQRWRLPRDDYPRDRPGYLTWRRDLGRFQAERAAEVLAEVGYEQGFRERVAALIRKERLRRDPDAQALEDTACLVFLEHHLRDFAATQDREKLLRILRKTWYKMSPRGQELALTLPMTADTQALVQEALA